MAISMNGHNFGAFADKGRRMYCKFGVAAIIVYLKLLVHGLILAHINQI